MRSKIFFMVAGFFLIAAVSFGMIGGQVIYKGKNRSLTLAIRTQDAETAAALVSLVSLAVGMARREREE